jgi:hypothetical protein
MASAATSRSSKRGAGLILYFEDKGEKYLLVGKESRWIQDLNDLDAITMRILKRFQEYKEDNDLDKANKYFSEMAKELEGSLKTNPVINSVAFMQNFMVRFDTPAKLDGVGYSVHYRYLPKEGNFLRGIVKGGMEPEDMGDTKKTIMREFREEVGIKLSESQLSFFKNEEMYDIYTHEVPLTSVKIFNERIKDRTMSRKGEIYDLTFKSATEIMRSSKKQGTSEYLVGYNRKSQAIKDFLSSKTAATPAAASASATPASVTPASANASRGGRKHTTGLKGRKHTIGRKHTKVHKGRKHTKVHKGRTHKKRT